MRAAVLFLFAALAAAGGEAGEHVAVMSWRDGTGAEPVARSITLLDKRPEGLRVPVEAKGALFGSAIVGDGARLCVAVTKKTLWIDRDMDGDLTKGRPRNWLGDETRRYCGIHLKVPFLGQKKPAGISVLARNVSARQDRICLLSDGSPTAGRFQQPKAIVEAVREINELKRITIQRVSVGYDSLLLKVLARNNGGLYTVR